MSDQIAGAIEQRRFKQIIISAEQVLRLADHATWDGEEVSVDTYVLPPECTLMSVDWSIECRAFVVTLASPYFSPVLPGHFIEMMSVECERILAKRLEGDVVVFEPEIKDAKHG